MNHSVECIPELGSHCWKDLSPKTPGEGHLSEDLKILGGACGESWESRRACGQDLQGCDSYAPLLGWQLLCCHGGCGSWGRGCHSEGEGNDLLEGSHSFRNGRQLSSHANNTYPGSEGIPVMVCWGNTPRWAGCCCYIFRDINILILFWACRPDSDLPAWHQGCGCHVSSSAGNTSVDVGTNGMGKCTSVNL